MCAEYKNSNGTIEAVKVLLIEDNPGDARLIQEMLSEAEDITFFFDCVERVYSGLDRLASEEYDVVLLDLSLPDSDGFDTFNKIHSQQPDIPIVVLTGTDDKALGIRAVHKGAQDYLVKGKVGSNLLSRSILYAIERQRMVKKLRSLSIKDNLTGLYNRRGFFTLSQQQLKTARRMGGAVLFLFADIDGLKKINDTLGHKEGDKALRDVAVVLKNTFRQSDIIGRIGGDEFAVLVIKKEEMSGDSLVERLQENLAHRNKRPDCRCSLSLSVGIAVYNPDKPTSINELLEEADRMMYLQKKNRDHT